MKMVKIRFSQEEISLMDAKEAIWFSENTLNSYRHKWAPIVLILFFLMFGLGLLMGITISRDVQADSEARQPKAGVSVLWLEAPNNSIRIRVEPPEEVETMKSLQDYLNKFPGAKVTGQPLAAQ